MLPESRIYSMRRAQLVAIALALAAICSTTIESRASSVVAMSVKTMADYAGQVIIGDVARARSYWAQNPKRIETEVTFENVQFLKGKHADAKSTFSLIIPGGTIGQTSMRICCAPEFKSGQRRILFLLPQYKTFPTVGLDQGSFQIIRDAQGVDRVYQSASVPVVGFDSETFALHGGQAPRDVHQHLKDANGAIIRSVEPEAANQPAISLADFLHAVQPILDASTNHNMHEPAGRRILVELNTTTLKAASQATPTAQPNSAITTTPSRHAKQSVQPGQSTQPREVFQPIAEPKPAVEPKQGGNQ